MPNVSHEELEDLRPVLAGLHGHQFAHVLYERHVAAMQATGREPVHPVRLGQILIQYGALRKAKWDPEKRCMVKGWLV